MSLGDTTARVEFYTLRQSQDWASGLQQILRQMLDFARRCLNYQQKADENQQLNPAQIQTLFFFFSYL